VGAGGTGGSGGAGGDGIGGAIDTGTASALTIAASLKVRKGSPRSRATYSISGNQASFGRAGLPGAGAGAAGGQGGAPNGSAGRAMPGSAGALAGNGKGIGGGLFRAPNAKVLINNTRITGNSASTTGSNEFDAAES
jgi:hypothetical protein